MELELVAVGAELVVRGRVGTQAGTPAVEIGVGIGTMTYSASIQPLRHTSKHRLNPKPYI